MFYARGGERLTEETNPDDLDLGALKGFGQIATDAISYWEPRRLLYNLVLAFAALPHALTYWRSTGSVPGIEHAAWLFVLAVLANACYCLAYIVDVFVQLSRFRAIWRADRGILFVVGLVFATVLAFALGSVVFSPPGID